MKNGLAKDHSISLHGLAIVLMLYHHLFSVPSRLGCEYFSVIDWFAGEGTGERAAWFCKICVAIYAFTTGYAFSRMNLEHAAPISCQRMLKQLGRFAKKYYLVYVIFIPLGFLLADFSSYGAKAVVLGLFGDTTYNSEWWYVKFYTCALIAFPFMDTVYRNLYNTLRFKHSEILSMLCACAMFVFITNLMGEPKTYAIILMEGYACSQFRLFELADRLVKTTWRRLALSSILLAAVIAVRVALSTGVGYNTIDIIIIIPFIYSVTAIFNFAKGISKLFCFLGKYSTYMWLTHTFFAYYIFRDFITISKVDILMFIQLFIVSLLTAYLLTKLERLFDKAAENLRPPLHA